MTGHRTIPSAPEFVLFAVAAIAACFAGGAALASYLFNRYVTREKP